MDSLRDLIWKKLLEKGPEVQMRYESALPDAFPMPKKQYLYPAIDVVTWEALVDAYLKSLEALREQAIEKATHRTKPDPPWTKSDPDAAFYERF